MVDTVCVFGLFGRHVIDGAHVHAALGQAAGSGLVERIIGVDDPSQAQVKHANGPGAIEHQVAGLDITVNDPLGMRRLEAAGRLDQVVDGVVKRQRPLRGDDAVEVAPLNVVHHQEMNTTVFIGVERGDQVEVLDPAGCLDFAAEPHDRAGVAGERRRKDLERTYTPDACGVGP